MVRAVSDMTTAPQTEQQPGNTVPTSPAPATQGDQADPVSPAQTTQATQGGQQPGKAEQQQGRVFTQTDLDRIIADRLARERAALRRQFAQALGLEPDEAPADPAKALEQAQQDIQRERDRADRAEARALALQAGVNPERVDTFVRLLDLAETTKGIDPGDTAARTQALTDAVAATLAMVPEFKATPVPTSSGGDRQQTAPGKRVWSRAEVEQLSPAELARHAAELAEAAAEGRIR